MSDKIKWELNGSSDDMQNKLHSVKGENMRPDIHGGPAINLGSLYEYICCYMGQGSGSFLELALSFEAYI